jgi:hypothetical protein
MQIIIWAQNKEQFAEAKREGIRYEAEGRFTFSNIDQFDPTPSQHGAVDIAVVLAKHENTEQISAFYEKREVRVIVFGEEDARPREKKTRGPKKDSKAKETSAPEANEEAAQ